MFLLNQKNPYSPKQNFYEERAQALFLLFSVLFNDQIKPILAGIVVIVGMPFLSMFEGIKWLNPYPYILGTQVISKGTFDGIYSLALLAITAVITWVGLAIFKRKEF